MSAQLDDLKNGPKKPDPKIAELQKQINELEAALTSKGKATALELAELGKKVKDVGTSVTNLTNKMGTDLVHKTDMTAMETRLSALFQGKPAPASGGQPAPAPAPQAIPPPAAGTPAATPPTPPTPAPVTSPPAAVQPAAKNPASRNRDGLWIFAVLALVALVLGLVALVSLNKTSEPSAQVITQQPTGTSALEKAMLDRLLTDKDERTWSPKSTTSEQPQRVVVENYIYNNNDNTNNNDNRSSVRQTVAPRQRQVRRADPPKEEVLYGVVQTDYPAVDRRPVFRDEQWVQPAPPVVIVAQDDPRYRGHDRSYDDRPWWLPNIDLSFMWRGGGGGGNHGGHAEQKSGGRGRHH